MVLSISSESPTAFFAALRAKVLTCERKSLLVFVHGYHVSFADAARRTAQMAYDLGFDGAPVFFSWPSQDRVLAYTVDEQSIADAQPHLEHFLRDVLKQSNAENVYLIAHSMGNRGLTRALAALAVTEPQEVKRIKEVILAAPDMSTVEFTEQVVPGLRKLGAPITLYASSNDRALALSEQLHGGKRAGESGDHLVVLNGIETIDASNTDTDLVGHSYYGDRRTVLADMWYLINGDMRARQRCCLKPTLFHSLPYWVFLK
jgi:esterase/lipase superfamily enzyme